MRGPKENTMLDRRVKHARLGVPLLVFASAMAFGGCDDNNFFQPPTGPPPEILALSAPAQVQAGQKLDVAVRAKGTLPLDSVVVKVRGAFSGDESVIFETVTYDQSVVVGFDVPIAIVDTIATVTAYAYDVNGQVSTAVQDQVRIIDRTPPTVSVSSKDDNVGQGGTLEIGLKASDNVGLAQAGYRLLQESGDTLAVVLATVSGTKVDTTFLYPISDDLAEGALLIEGIAVDVDGNTGTDQESTALQVIDVIPPVVAVGVPQEGASFATSLPLPVSLDFYDNSGVTKLRIEGYALRDNPFTGIPDRIARYEMLEVEFGEAIPDSSFSALLVAIPDNTGEDAFLVVTATDARGNAGADTVTIALDPAQATAGIVAPAEGATQAVGQPLGAALAFRVAGHHDRCRRIGGHAGADIGNVFGHRGSPAVAVIHQFWIEVDR